MEKHSLQTRESDLESTVSSGLTLVLSLFAWNS